MSTQDKLARVGFWSEAAKAINGDVATAQTAAGTTQADAFALSADTTMFGTVGAGAGAILRAVPGRQMIYNGGANACLVYPPVGGTINSGAANASFSVATTKSAQFYSADGVTFVAVLSA